MANPPSLLLRHAMWLMEPTKVPQTGNRSSLRARIILARLLLRMRLHNSRHQTMPALQFQLSVTAYTSIGMPTIGHRYPFLSGRLTTAMGTPVHRSRSMPAEHTPGASAFRIGPVPSASDLQSKYNLSPAAKSHLTHRLLRCCPLRLTKFTASPRLDPSLGFQALSAYANPVQGPREILSRMLARVHRPNSSTTTPV